MQALRLMDAEQDAPLRLLVVDDDDVDRERLRRMLTAKRHDATIDEASTSAEALELLAAGRFDCMFLDYHLGGEIGTELLAHVDALTDQVLPVILVTGQGDERLVVSAMHAGVFDYIPKVDLSSELVHKALGQCIERARLEDRLKLQQERLERLSLYDSLTELPNRTLFFDRLEQCVRTSQRQRQPFAVLVMDLDLFKDVNDTFGHEAGDTVLRVCAARMAGALRDSDTVARFGGDEFAAVLWGAASHEDASNIARKIGERVRQPIPLDSAVVHVGVSIGIAMYPDHGADGTELLASADRAMYRAKQARSGHHVDGKDESTTRAAERLGDRLQRAIKRGELCVEFQPMIDLVGHTFVGTQALVRWRSPVDSLVLPVQLSVAAEQSSALGPLTWAVVDLVLEQMRTWQDGGLQIPVAMCLSARLLDDTSSAQRLLDALHGRALAPTLLTINLSDSTLVADIEPVRVALQTLHNAGVRLAVDDFGVGFTSLRYLRDLDLADIRNARPFSAAPGAQPQYHAILHSIAALDRALGASALAAAIAQQGTPAELPNPDSERGQGYAIARPLAADRLPDWIAQQRLRLAETAGDCD